MGDFDWLEWLGYLASMVIVVSLMMSSIVRLRWINLIGAVLFSAYGFLIGALPVGVLNAAIAAIDVYYLVRMAATRDYFQFLSVTPGEDYLEHFLDFHRLEIGRLFPDFGFDSAGCAVSFFVLRNTVPAGLFLATADGDDLRVDVDFVAPEFRDFEIGRRIFQHGSGRLAATGCRQIVARAADRRHERYLARMGFTRRGEQGGRPTFTREIASR